MNAATENRVNVVGAGPVGLLCALELASRHVPVLVIEAEPRTALDLRAGTFHPPTPEMLRESGVTDAMMAIDIRVPHCRARGSIAGSGKPEMHRRCSDPVGWLR